LPQSVKNKGFLLKKYQEGIGEKGDVVKEIGEGMVFFVNIG
jgi:hypothetical protein